MPVPGVEVTDETGKLPPYVSTVLSFAVARFGTMEETMRAAQPSSAVLIFASRSIGSPVKESRQLCCRGVELKRKSSLLTIKSYYVEGGFSHLIHMTAAHLW